MGFLLSSEVCRIPRRNWVQVGDPQLLPHQGSLGLGSIRQVGHTMRGHGEGSRSVHQGRPHHEAEAEQEVLVEVPGTDGEQTRQTGGVVAHQARAELATELQ